MASPISHARLAARRALGLIFLAAVLWGTVGVASKAIYSIADINALSIGFYRLLFSLPVLWWSCWRRFGRATLRVPRRDIGVMVIIGCAMAAYQVLYFAAIARVGVAVAVLITLCVAPIIVAAASTLLLHERLPRAVIIALLCALGGTALLVAGAPATTLAGGFALGGVVLALGAAAGYASITLASRAVADRYHPLQTIAIAFTAGALLLLPFVLMQGLTLHVAPYGWALLVYLGLVPTALAYLLFFSGMRSTSATVASIVTLVEPLVSTLLAWLLFGEHLGSGSVVGAALLLAAMLMLFRRQR